MREAWRRLLGEGGAAARQSFLDRPLSSFGKGQPSDLKFTPKPLRWVGRSVLWGRDAQPMHGARQDSRHAEGPQRRTWCGPAPCPSCQLAPAELQCAGVATPPPRPLHTCLLTCAGRPLLLCRRALDSSGILTLGQLLSFYPKSHHVAVPGQLPDEDDMMVCLPVRLQGEVEVRGAGRGGAEPGGARRAGRCASEQRGGAAGHWRRLGAGSCPGCRVELRLQFGSVMHQRITRSPPPTHVATCMRHHCRVGQALRDSLRAGDAGGGATRGAGPAGQPCLALRC